MRLSSILACACLAALACSSQSGTSAPPQQSKALLQRVAEDPADRLVVAEVNEVPIYADCVQTQASAHALTREDALQECIDFELLAQAADLPKYLQEEDVQEKSTRELVRTFLASEYSLQSPDDMPDSLVQELWKAVSPRRYNRPELRDIVFCRIPLPKGTSVSSPPSKKASAFLQGLYEDLKDRSDLKKDDLFGACYGNPGKLEDEVRPYQKVGIEKLDLSTFTPTPRSRYQPAFQERIFDGPQKVGMVLRPLFSQYGWDLILLTQILPKLETDFASAEPELRKALFEEPAYEAQRAALFNEWYATLEKKHRITKNFDLLPAAGPLAISASPGLHIPPAKPGVGP